VCAYIRVRIYRSILLPGKVTRVIRLIVISILYSSIKDKGMIRIIVVVVVAITGREYYACVCICTCTYI
jgi:hypothetical protein